MEDSQECGQLPFASADLREARPSRSAAQDRAALFPLRMELQQDRAALRGSAPAYPADTVHLETPRDPDGIHTGNSACNARARAGQPASIARSAFFSRNFVPKVTSTS